MFLRMVKINQLLYSRYIYYTIYAIYTVLYIRYIYAPVFEITGNNHCGGGNFDHCFKHHSSTVIISCYFEHCTRFKKCTTGTNLLHKNTTSRITPTTKTPATEAAITMLPLPFSPLVAFLYVTLSDSVGSKNDVQCSK